MARLLSHALVLALAIVIASTSARADELNPDLEQARRDKQALRYEDARAALARALARGGNSPAQLAEIYRLRGEVAAGLDDPRAAEESFRRLLALDPDATLPAGVSPKIADPFAAARASLEGRPPLTVTHAIERSGSPVLVIDVAADPVGMVAGARVEYLRPGGRWITSEVRGRGRLQLGLPAAPLLSLAISVTDAAGNVLVFFGTRDRPLEVATAAPSGATGPTDRAVSSTPLVARWQLWGGIALTFAAASTYFAIDTMRTQRDLDAIYDDAGTTEWTDVMDRIDDLERRGERSALLANIGFGVAGASALAAVVLLIRDAATSEQPANGLSLAPRRGGVTVGWRYRF